MKNERYTIIGNNIRRLRKKKYYSQKKLAELLEISPNHLYRIETAKSQISLSLLLKLTDILETEINELLMENVKIKQGILGDIEGILAKSTDIEREIIRQTIFDLYHTLRTVVYEDVSS